MSAVRTTFTGSMMPACTYRHTPRCWRQSQYWWAFQRRCRQPRNHRYRHYPQFVGWERQRIEDDGNAELFIAFADDRAFSTASRQRSKATPPPGRIPSSTAARVACNASSTRAFFCFISVSVSAPTLITATPQTVLPGALAVFPCRNHYRFG